ncbi:hypothetical protein [Actinomadura coerulea]|uniref:hypothetical protein n=1 Tax=Actinomadura coerulea TaxID=46159 RepID=UPI00343E91BF
MSDDAALAGADNEEAAEAASEEEIREALVILLARMRPDWGGRRAIAQRVGFARERLLMPLARVCADAVRGAAQPGSPPDVFIAIDARVPVEGGPADPATVAEVAAQARRALIGRRPSSARPC